jgi:hypothetical protein
MNTKHRHCMFVIFIVFSIFLWLKIPVYSELTGTVTGKVMDEETGKGIKGVLVVLQRIRRYPGYWINTDNDGSFTIFDVEEGIYKISFCPPSPYAWAKVTLNNSTYE